MSNCPFGLEPDGRSTDATFREQQIDRLRSTFHISNKKFLARKRQHTPFSCNLIIFYRNFPQG